MVRPALERGAVVISDRYVDSSLAYQGAGRQLPVRELAELSQWATGRAGAAPHRPARRRPRGRASAGRPGTPDRIEQESLAFHRAVRAGFLQLADADPDRYLVLSASSAPGRMSMQRWLPPYSPFVGERRLARA